MMLQNIMGMPLLCWLASSLIAEGVGRFFLVCHERFRREARECIPEEAECVCPNTDETSDQLHVFLSTAEDDEQDVTVVTGPAVLADQPAPSGAAASGPICSVSRDALMDALDDSFLFTDFLREHGAAYRGGSVCAVPDLSALCAVQPILSRGVLCRLARQGVQIWDFSNTYVEPTVCVGAGTAILPGTVLRGKTVVGKDCTLGPNTLLEDATIGERTKVNASQVYSSGIGSDCQLGPFAYVRPGSRIGSGVRVGDFVEIKNSVICDGTKISHLTYVGDSDVGRNCNFGCGTVTVNYDRVKKYRTTIGDNAFIGCNTNLIAPVTVGSGSYIAAGSTITDDIPEQALAIARARQQNKKDWAARHKQKESL